ncbi:hypothetical protein DH2020_026149 [Rehmannia glutinosa]|nr:R2R3-MYB protein [Rehmannia glutinosa]
MGRAPCCDKANVKKGPWSPEEDEQLKEYIDKHGTGGNWIALPQKAGLRRCGKSCRLRWLNYLRPNIKHGEFSDDEDRIICSLFARIGSRWSVIAAQLPGRTDNDIKNYWNTKLKKKLLQYDQKMPDQATTTFPLIIPSNNNNSLVQNSSLPISDYSPTYQISPSPYDQFGNNTIISSSNHLSAPSVHDGNLGFQSYFNIDDGNDDQKFLTSAPDEKGENGNCFSEINPLDYSIEEIKQLISTNNICNNMDFFHVDEIKKEETDYLYY